MDVNSIESCSRAPTVSVWNCVYTLYLYLYTVLSAFWRDDFTHVYKLFVVGVEKEETRGQFAGGRRLRECPSATSGSAIQEKRKQRQIDPSCQILDST
jgi:hypothetical protein